MRTRDNRPLDRTKLVMVKREKAAAAAQEALFPIQSVAPEVQLMGVALLFAVLCKRCGVEPQDLHDMALKVLEPKPGDIRTNDSLEALRDYAGLRLMGQDVTIS